MGYLPHFVIQSEVKSLVINSLQEIGCLNPLGAFGGTIISPDELMAGLPVVYNV